jgi:hypothetical protein
VKPALTITALKIRAKEFAVAESAHHESSLFGVTDGKAIGTYLEHKFIERLALDYTFVKGSSAKGIDLPDINVDIKVTSIRQPQSSCPYKSARQKMYGLGYSLLVFVYDKTDNPANRTGNLNVLHVIFIKAERTADFQTTTGIRQIIKNQGNEDDLIAFMADRMLPLDDITAMELAKEILTQAPELGYLTISNALQWRLQYQRVIDKAGSISGIVRVR